MSARQFGRASFKPSHLGVGESRGGDDVENAENEIVDDEAGSSSAKASSSAAFMNASGVVGDSGENMNTQPYVEDDGMDLANQPAAEDPAEELLPAEELDKVLNDSDDEDAVGVDSQEIEKNPSGGAVDPGLEEVDTQENDILDGYDTSDSDDDNMRDLSQAAEAAQAGFSQATDATMTQRTDDLFGDSDSDEDEAPAKSPAAREDGSQPTVSQQTAAEMFPDSDDDEEDVEARATAAAAAAQSSEDGPSTEPQDAMIAASGADLDDDSVEMEVAASQRTVEEGGLEDSDDDMGMRTSSKKSKKDKNKKMKKLSKKAGSIREDGDDDEEIIDDEPVQTISTKPTSVEQEVAAIAAVDEGPSAEDIEREGVFKVDQEEIDRKLDIINGQVMMMMQKRLLDADEQRNQLEEMRSWFQKVRATPDEELASFVREEMMSALRAVRGGDGERYMASLEQFLARAEDADDSDMDFDPTEFDDDDDEEEEEEGKQGQGVAAGAGGSEGHEIIEFSDSEDEGEDAAGEGEGEGEKNKVDTDADADADDGLNKPKLASDTDPSQLVLPLEQSQSMGEGDDIVPLPDVIQKGDPLSVGQQHQQQSVEVHMVHRVTPDVKNQSAALKKQQIKRRFLAASKSVRAGAHTSNKPDLKRELKREQKAKIESNSLRSFSRIYCRRIDLTRQKEIAAKCRLLSDLFFQRVERKVAVKKLREVARREKLRREYLRSANDDEGEMDDGEMDGDGRFGAAELTEEEQAAAEQRFIEEGLRLEEEAEEDAAAAELGGDLPVDETEGEQDDDAAAVAEDDAMQVGGEEGEKEENEEIALARSLKTKGASEEDDDNLDSAPSAARSGWVEEGDDDAATQTQTQTQPQGGASEGAAAGEDEVMLDSDNEEAAPEAPRLSKDELRRQEMIKRAKKQGKSLYQLQVEEEERRARGEKRGGLFDTEAEEEEETGMQAGLEDFGFGTSKVREGDEERDALKMRADDFKNIADDLSDDEKENRDEDAAARFRAKQAELDDMIAAKKIISGDLGKKNKGRGGLSEEFLAGAESSAQFDPDADVEEQIAELDKKLKEFSEEELLEQIQEEKRAQQAKMQILADDSDSDGGSDSDDNDEDPDEAFMTNEQKEAHRAEKLRLKESKQKARIQQAEFKALARSRRFFRQESTRKAREDEMRFRRAGSQDQSQNVLNGANGASDGSAPPVNALKRTASTALLRRQPSVPRLASGGAPPQPLRQRSTSGGNLSSAGGSSGDLSRQPSLQRVSSLQRNPSLVRSRSHTGEKTTLVRQASLASGGELGGSEKLAFKRQRSQLAAKNNSVKGPGAAAHSSNVSAAHAFLFRNAGAAAAAASTGADSSSAPAASSGGHTLKRKGSLYSSMSKN